MKVVDLETKLAHSIELFRTTGEEKMTCPVCSETRKKKHIKCFSWNHSKQLGFCSHCEASFGLPREDKEIVYEVPTWKNNTKLSENVVKWFECRGISQRVLRELKITEGNEYMPQVSKKVNTIQFNYFRNGELVNVKHRDGAKNFKLHSGAELIFYNYDNVKESKEIVIVEGEIDALSLMESNIYNVVSVPNGGGSKNFEYLDNCIELFKEDVKIVLATDNDIVGVTLRNNLAARLGVENCKIVDFKDKKDANEYLIKYGAEVLHETIMNAKQFPVDGVFSCDDFSGEIDYLYENGLKPALQIGLGDFDRNISFDFNRVYTFTGIPGHGKSEFVDQIAIKLNVLHNLKVAYFSPENFPLELHASKIIEKITGVRFNSQSLAKGDYEMVKDYYRKNFFSISPEDNFTVETILEKAKYLVKRNGVKVLVIDPYNTLEHKHNGKENEHEYVSRFMDIIRNFAKRNNIMIFLVAHPRKMPKNNGIYEVPTMYDISGSSNFYNKTDFGVSIYRNFASGQTEVYVQKVKFKHMGEVGKVDFMWNKDNGRYSYYDSKIDNWVIDNQNYLRQENNEDEKAYEYEPNKDFFSDLAIDKTNPF